MPAYFNNARNGYNPEEVDKYINNLETIIKDYKDKDSAIASAIVNAQVAADNIIKNAELAAEEIRNGALEQLDRISDSVEKQRLMIQAFQEEYNEVISRYLKKINQDDFKNLYDHITGLDNYFDKLKNSQAPQEEQADEQAVPDSAQGPTEEGQA